VTSEEALLITLYQMAYLGRWIGSGTALLFHQSPCELSEIFNTTVSLLYEAWHSLISCWHATFELAHAHALGEACAHKMGYHGGLFMCFFNGTFIYIQRPGGNNNSDQFIMVIFINMVSPTWLQ